jgi:hypothetical protein
MVYNQTRMDWFIVRIAYVYRCIHCASHEGMTLTREV